MARKSSPARLIIALSVAAVLAVFLLYTSLAGGGTPSLVPSKVAGHAERVSLSGQVVGPVTGDAHKGGLHFGLVDPTTPDSKTTQTPIPVVYMGSVPDLFRAGRDVVVDGKLQGGTFVAVPDTLVTKCPSKYSPSAKSSA